MHNIAVQAERYGAEIGLAVRADLILYVAALLYLLAGSAYLLAMRHPFIAEYDVYAMGCIALCCIVLPYASLLIGASRILLFAGTRRRLAWRTLVSPRRVSRGVAGTLLMLVLLLLFEAMYTSVKTTFSSAHFPFDRLVADFDKALHFGHAPAYWLAFMRADWLLRLIETNYDVVWFPLWLWTLYWFCVTPRGAALRVRFVLTFMLAWAIVGNVFASVLLTAGPALYGHSTGDDTRFAKLAQFLQSTPNSTAATQNYLWALHQAGSGGLGSGISAFPSMHVAVTTVCALFLSEFDRRLCIPAWTNLAIICVSSVYLGWHYAVDGYAAITMTVAIYWAVRAAPQLLKVRFRWRRSAGAGRPVFRREDMASS